MGEVGEVVDTNVLISANGRDTHVDKLCRLACARKIDSIRHKGKVYIDDRNLVFEEYRNRLNFSGEPGAGDAFFKYIHENQFADSRVKRVQITPNCDESRGFDELPKNALDRSDRKFLAVAVVANASILNATDSDWHENRELLDDLHVVIRQLCPQMLRRRSS